MNRTFFFPLLAAAALLACCSETHSPAVSSDTEAVQMVRADGDETVYGLACEGSNDSMLVFLTLPYNGADPDTVDILAARRNRRIFGLPHVGDMVAIMRSDSDNAVAASLIVTEQLQGHWCYTVLPELRRPMPGDSLPRVIREKLNTPREYSLVISPEHLAHSFGVRHQQSDDMSPVAYPSVKHYTQWAIYNGRLVFTETLRDSDDNRQIVCVDTADIVRLRRDTLVLSFADGDHTYYRKAEQESQ